MQHPSESHCGCFLAEGCLRWLSRVVGCMMRCRTLHLYGLGASNAMRPCSLLQFSTVTVVIVVTLLACSVGAHARAAQCFEGHLRAQYGGTGLNPASYTPAIAYDHADVSFLLQVYAQLEEPDGVAGEWGRDKVMFAELMK